jgi:hypothetical protein
MNPLEPNASFEFERQDSAPSALRSPRGMTTPKGSVRFGGDVPPLPTATKTTAGKGSTNKGAKPSRAGGSAGATTGMTPLKTLAPTVGTIADQLSLLHDMILGSDFAPLVKKSCHIELFDADRVISDYAGRSATTTAATTRVRRHSATRVTPRTNGGGAGAAASSEGSPASENGEGESVTSEVRLSREARRAKMERSWARFLKCVSGNLSSEEVELLSLPTVKGLMKHYGIDRDPVDTANIELYWRELAQRREDRRNQSAIMNKTCGAVSQPAKHQATRDLSASFDKRSDKRR